MSDYRLNIEYSKIDLDFPDFDFPDEDRYSS